MSLPLRNINIRRYRSSLVRCKFDKQAVLSLLNRNDESLCSDISEKDRKIACGLLELCIKAYDSSKKLKGKDRESLLIKELCINHKIDRIFNLRIFDTNRAFLDNLSNDYRTELLEFENRYNRELDDFIWAHYLKVV